MLCYILIFFFNDTATTEIYPLSLHDALPISVRRPADQTAQQPGSRDLTSRNTVLGGRAAQKVNTSSMPRGSGAASTRYSPSGDRKSTRLNSSHANISYAVFCLKKKKNKT